MHPNWLTDSICPIFKANEEGKLDFEGSSVLLKIGDLHLLITAAHVVDANAKSALYVSGSKRLIELSKVASSSSRPPEGRVFDSIDVAYCLLSSSVIATLKDRFIFLPIDILNLSAVTSPRRLYTFTGFPSTKVKINPKLRKTNSQRFSYTSIGIDEDRMKKMGLHPNSHTVVEFNAKRTKDDKGRRVTPPQLYGISGGAVWVWPRNSSGPHLKNPRLTAIVIEHRRSEKVLVAVNIEFALAAIVQDHPYLREHLPVSRRINIKTKKIDG